MPKVSIIVPVYNVEKYLNACLESLKNQTLKDIEVICVNDGSTDNSLSILESFAKNDRRFIVINQENGGRSLARNAGLKKASSSYIMFCDSDDLYDEKMCEKMVKVMDKYEVDVAVCGIAIKYEAHLEIRDSDDAYYRLKYFGRTFIDDNVIKKTDASVCNKIFRSDLVEKCQIRFPEKLNNEDYYFYNAYMSVAKTCYFLNRKLYKYIRHEGSIMSDNFNKDIYSPDHLLIAEKLFEFYEKNDYIEGHVDLFWRQFSDSFWFSYVHSAKKHRKKIQMIAKDFILKNYDKYPPIDKKVKNSVNVILNYNIYNRGKRFLKSAAKKTYLKINFAYRQQDYINAHLEELYEKFGDLSDRLDNLTKED